MREEILFQSTLPHGERRLVITYILELKAVSIHAPAWGATQYISYFFKCFWFQSTLPHGERPKTLRKLCTFQPFQSTLPHGERRHEFEDGEPLISVSIHAPAWGATGSVVALILVYGGFNPRSRMGSDAIHWTTVAGSSVSIHAPAWGATLFSSNSLSSSSVSIHAPAWGAT